MISDTVIGALLIFLLGLFVLPMSASFWISAAKDLLYLLDERKRLKRFEDSQTTKPLEKIK